MRFENKVCVVTGGSSGIGRATVLQLIKEGGFVAFLNRSEEEGHDLEEQIIAGGSSNGLFIKTDLAVPEDIEKAVKIIVDKWHKVDVLINNAAMMTYKPITELSVEEWDKVLAVNLRAAFLLCKHCLPYMENAAVVNVSSVHAHETTANVISYASSKGALEAFTRGMSREYEPKKLRINCVAPGAVDTPMLWDNPNVKNGTETVEGAIGQPEQIAAAICFLASDDAGFINGTTLVVDGGRLQIL